MPRDPRTGRQFRVPPGDSAAEHAGREPVPELLRTTARCTHCLVCRAPLVEPGGFEHTGLCPQCAAEDEGIVEVREET